jgi:hypothetical protein
MTPEQREQLERDGWQLLLWSYRRELLGDDADQDSDDGPHRE